MSAIGTRPNVIFVLTDDQGYGDLSCHGNPVLRTPCLDRLHAESARFTDFHVTPVCAPTRGEIMTGRDALIHGASFVCMGRSLLRADLPTMADIFAANGYQTGHFGKWHLGDNYPYRPQDRGFHETIHHPAWGITSAPDYFGNDYFDDHYRHRDAIEQFKGYCTDVWFDQALSWIDGCRRRGDPFFAYIATNAPHGPLWVPDRYRQEYIGEVERREASFFGMIACIDENMARLESFLRQRGLRENTILIFMTDNGTASGSRVFNSGMRGGKKSLYEGGHRVPFFVRWPAAGIGGGRDIGGLTRATDVLPTLIDLCGLRTADGLTFDGLSLASALRSGAAPNPQRMAVVQYGHENEGVWGYTQKHTAAVLWRNWRLVNGEELYDLETDPAQERDATKDRPEIARRLAEFYEGWWSALGGGLREYQRIAIGSAAENPVCLCSADWAWAYADNQASIRGCAMASGTWHVEVARSGRYELALRRWPEESGLGIAVAAPPMQGVDGTWPEGKALPVASAWLRAGPHERTIAVPPGATHAAFEMDLECGPAEIKSWWRDNDGLSLAGAYYLTAKRVSG